MAKTPKVFSLTTSNYRIDAEKLHKAVAHEFLTKQRRCKRNPLLREVRHKETNFSKWGRKDFRIAFR